MHWKDFELLSQPIPGYLLDKDGIIDNHKAPEATQQIMRILNTSITRNELQTTADELFGDLVKAVVDVRRGVMVIGGELHADEEALLLLDGSAQQDLWGINLYPSQQGEAMIEFDSMINVRPSQGNRSRTVENPDVRTTIIELIRKLIVE